jgi:LmbE family N-acetylglucosaminyl deacetylase
VTQTRTALFIGCHADDIELGAGGTVARLVSEGWTVWLCLLTKEADRQTAATRRREMYSAAKVLGVPRSRTLFAGFPDASLRCDGPAVGALRRLLSKHAVDPDLVFTHTAADSHNDHRVAHDLVRATFRKKLLLSYAVVNSLVSSQFQPSVFVNVDDFFDTKLAALSQHGSQSARIDFASVANLLATYGHSVGLNQAEPFEVLVQEGADSLLPLVNDLNHSPFHVFWSNLLGFRKLLLVHAVPVYRKRKEWDWPTDRDRDGIATLHQAFNEWLLPNPILDFSCTDQQATQLFDDYDVLLSGGAVSNLVTHRYFNHVPGIRYIIDYTMPDYRDIRIYDRKRNRSLRATYSDNVYGNRVPETDLGILTIMRHPSQPSDGRCVIGCMGIHGYGSLGCFKMLTQPNHLSELLEHVEIPLKADIYQLLIAVDAASGETRIRKSSTHVSRSAP